MSFGHVLSVWLRNLFQRDHVERDLDEELQAYVDLLTERKVQAGMTAEAARREALLDLGGVEQVKERCREVRRLHWLEVMKQDTSYGLRLLCRNPGFTAVAILTLSLGIGATTAIFTVVNGVLLRPLPYPQPDRLVYIKEDLGRGGGAIPFAYTPHYLAWRSRSTTLSQIGAYMDSRANLTGGGEPERIDCGMVTASFLLLLGAKPLLGRSLLPEDDRPGAAPVIILSHALWQRRFGGDPGVVGSVLTVDGENHTIVGVLPSTFRIPDRYSFAQDAWVPMLSKTGAARPILLRIVGRLTPGVSLESARAELDTILRSTLRPRQKNRVVITEWHEEIAGDVRFSLLVFLGAVSFVLLIACINVANLLLSQATVRQKEMAVRSALGAGKARILRQLLTESMLLTLGGAAVGLVLAVLGKDLLVAFISKSLPTLDPIRLDYTVLGFNLSLAVIVALAFGLAPGLRASSRLLKSGAAYVNCEPRGHGRVPR